MKRGRLVTLHPEQSFTEPRSWGLPANTAAIGACVLQGVHKADIMKTYSFMGQYTVVFRQIIPKYCENEQNN